ncbi:MAG: hypothetical protein IJK89_07950 [Clostridia bacterium]|nr:hypothetical protein [Clostridia bacterium]
MKTGKGPEKSPVKTQKPAYFVRDRIKTYNTAIKKGYMAARRHIPLLFFALHGKLRDSVDAFSDPAETAAGADVRRTPLP